jgi:hypothetical protein
LRESGGITVLCLLLRRFVSEDPTLPAGVYSASSAVSDELAVVVLSVLQTVTSLNFDNGQSVRLVGGIPPVVQLLRRGPQVRSHGTPCITGVGAPKSVVILSD